MKFNTLSNGDLQARAYRTFPSFTAGFSIVPTISFRHSKFSGVATRMSFGTRMYRVTCSCVPPQIARSVGYSPLNNSDAWNGCRRLSAQPSALRLAIALQR
jgi:hypothetical protein